MQGSTVEMDRVNLQWNPSLLVKNHRFDDLCFVKLR